MLNAQLACPPRWRRPSAFWATLVLLVAAPLTASDLRRTPLVKAIERARPSVVNIHSEKTLTSPDERFGNIETSRRVNGMGTGVVVDERGYIVTNQHVIDGVEKIRVTMHDGSVFTGKLVSADKENDLAVIKIDPPEPMTVITIGTSSDLMAGEPVVAVGNAYGYEHTVTRGIISAMNRTVQLSETQQYIDLIQTDASINPGNSGGPLLNIDGEMIGVNVAVRAGAQGIGFAIPVDKALEVASQLLGSEKLAGARHGVKAAPLAERGPLKGFVVGRVDSSSPAGLAGLQEGDVITSCSGRSVERALDFERALIGKKVGDSVSLAGTRSGEPFTVDLTLEGGKARPMVATVDPETQSWQMLGVKLASLDGSQLGAQRSRYRGGLLVSAVREEGPAEKQGIRTGDVLVGLHIWETVTTENVAHILGRA
ncbi:MAG TPA: trypsin-like peptidase domain-containing protein, partial [Pirellulales bacterium]